MIDNPPAASLKVTGKAAVGDDGAAPRPLLLAYQMQKVASMSWVALGRRQFAPSDILHVHFIAEKSLAFLRAQYQATGPSQTIKRRMLLRELLRTGQEARALLCEAAGQARPIALVTGMRDPVARSISLLFFLSDFYGHTSDRWSWRDGASTEDVERAFIATWEQALDTTDPADTFSRTLCFFIREYRSWFDRETCGVLGIDVVGASFPAGPGRRLLARGQTQALIYRIEDMLPDTPGHAALLADAAAICGAPVSHFPLQNAAAFRNSRDLHRRFLERVRLPARLLERIYDDPVVRCFYSEEEIVGFRRRWLGGPS